MLVRALEHVAVVIDGQEIAFDAGQFSVGELIGDRLKAKFPELVEIVARDDAAVTAPHTPAEVEAFGADIGRPVETKAMRKRRKSEPVGQ